MTDKRTKAELLADIENYEQVLSNRIAEVRLAQSEKREAQEECEHYKVEAERLSETAHRLEKEMYRWKEKHGDLIVTSQAALLNSVDVLRGVRPRLEHEDNEKMARSSIFSSHAPTHNPNDVRHYVEIPF
tara:strand:+ start:5005 stop:5394 length:390 start_codon:yes stop_codon:yes gene_type:complete